MRQIATIPTHIKGQKGRYSLWRNTTCDSWLWHIPGTRVNWWRTSATFYFYFIWVFTPAGEARALWREVSVTMRQLAMIHTHKRLKATLFIMTKHSMRQLAMIHTHIQGHLIIFWLLVSSDVMWHIRNKIHEPKRLKGTLSIMTKHNMRQLAMTHSLPGTRVGWWRHFRSGERRGPRRFDQEVSVWHCKT